MGVAATGVAGGGGPHGSQDPVSKACPSPGLRGILPPCVLMAVNSSLLTACDLQEQGLPIAVTGLEELSIYSSLQLPLHLPVPPSLYELPALVTYAFTPFLLP